MARLENLAIEVHLEDDGAPPFMGRDVHQGLTSSPKWLPSKYFYDERGSRLFERITELPEYYLTRAETALLERFSGAVARVTGVEQLIELGSGAAKKTRLLIDAALCEDTLQRYVPVEVSQEAVEHSARKLATRYPELAVRALVGDFEAHLGQVPHGGRQLIALLGSTIGNFPQERATKLLANVASLMQPGDWFLLGTDLVKDPTVLEAAYNDAQGVTAEFNLNILNVVNHHVDGNFDPRTFEHVAFYNEEQSRIESYLRSRPAQSIRLERIELDVDFEVGELLRTEISCKYTQASVKRLLETVGLRLQHWFTDRDEMFALSLATR